MQQKIFNIKLTVKSIKLKKSFIIHKKMSLNLTVKRLKLYHSLALRNNSIQFRS